MACPSEVKNLLCAGRAVQVLGGRAFHQFEQSPVGALQEPPKLGERWIRGIGWRLWRAGSARGPKPSGDHRVVHTEKSADLVLHTREMAQLPGERIRPPIARAALAGLALGEVAAPDLEPAPRVVGDRDQRLTQFHLRLPD
jgi:hypothetical protein